MQSVVLPLVVALVLTGVLRLAGGARVGPRVAALSIPIAFLCAYALISGVPPFPPRASTQKLFHISLLAGAAGLFLQLSGLPRVAGRAVAVFAPLLVAGWLGWPLARSMGGAAYLMGAGAAAWGMVALWRVTADQGPAGTRARGLVPPVVLLAATIAVAGIAFLGATLSLAMYGAALASALGGYLSWNLPGARFPAGELVTVGVGVTLAGLVTLLVFYTGASRIALVVVLSVFFAAPVARRVAGKRYRKGSALEPVIVFLVCTPLVLAAVAFAWVAADGSSGY